MAFFCKQLFYPLHHLSHHPLAVALEGGSPLFQFEWLLAVRFLIRPLRLWKGIDIGGT